MSSKGPADASSKTAWNVLSGARAMLDVRCVYLSGLWEEFIAFRIQRESRRLYPGSAANDPHFCQALAA